LSALIGAIIALGAGISMYVMRPRDITVERIEFDGVRGRLVGNVYRPVDTQIPKPLPGVLICHGVENNKEVVAHLAIEFARRGYVSIAFDYGGYGESHSHDDTFEIMVGDTLAALKVLTDLEDVDGRRLAMVGHSMGVSYSVATAEFVGDRVRAVVGLGNEAAAPKVPPRNLMLGMGLYDAFHTLEQMLDAVRESTTNPGIKPDQIAGDFKKGTARALFVSPISDHGMEPLDPILIKHSIEWVENSMGQTGGRGESIGIVETYRAEARMLLILSGGMLLTALLFLLYSSRTGSSEIRFLFRTPLLLLSVAAITGNLSDPAISLACTDFSLVVLAAGSIAAHLATAGGFHNAGADLLDDAAGRMFFGLAFIGIIVISLLAGLLLHGAPVALGRADWTAAIPRFLFHIPLLRPYEGWCMLRAYAFTSYSRGWIPEIWLGAVILVEAIRPGGVTWISGAVARTLVKAFRFKGPFKLRASGKSWVALAAALAGLIFIIAQRFREGWLSSEAVGKMAIIGLKFMIIPLLIFILLLNLPFFDNRENNVEKR